MWNVDGFKNFGCFFLIIVFFLDLVLYVVKFDWVEVYVFIGYWL